MLLDRMLNHNWFGIILVIYCALCRTIVTVQFVSLWSGLCYLVAPNFADPGLHRFLIILPLPISLPHMAAVFSGTFRETILAP